MVRAEDDGAYECQATTYPPQSIVIKLRVVGEYTNIINKLGA